MGNSYNNGYRNIQGRKKVQPGSPPAQVYKHPNNWYQVSKKDYELQRSLLKEYKKKEGKKPMKWLRWIMTLITILKTGLRNENNSNT